MTRKLTPDQLDEIEAATIRKQVVHAAVNGEPDKRFATVLALVAEVRELRAKVERVRGIHKPEVVEVNWVDETFCSVCYVEDEDCGFTLPQQAEWPCDTIKALGEEA